MWVRDRREAICPGSPRRFYSIKSPLRSDYWGFTFCIRAIFFERSQPLSSFSRASMSRSGSNVIRNASACALNGIQVPALPVAARRASTL